MNRSAVLSPVKGMQRVPSGTFEMGSNDHYREEAPLRQAHVDAFWIDAHPVTNAEFVEFVRETKYVTVAERRPDPAAYPDAGPALLVPGSLVFTPPAAPVGLHDPRAWWSYIAGACWNAPHGPGSSLVGRWDHPVVHVAYEDALAYARWARKDLPTEAEWERAARGGLEGVPYAWGEELEPQGRPMANIWRGSFPWRDLKPAHARGTTPVGAFPPNRYGLFDMIGNVWEWTKDDYSEPRASTCCGQGTGTPVDAKVVKGGSYLCSPDHCARYRPSARQPQTSDTSSCHMGFRCVLRAPREVA